MKEINKAIYHLHYEFTTRKEVVDVKIFCCDPRYHR